MKLSEAPGLVAEPGGTGHGSAQAGAGSAMSEIIPPGGCSVVHVAGLPSARCAFALAALPSSLVFGDGRPVPLVTHGSAEDVPWEPDEAPGALLLVLVDSPSSALLAMQSAASERELTSGLVQWRETARNALRCAHRHPRYCVLVDITVTPFRFEELFAGLGLATTEGRGFPIEVPESVQGTAIESILADRVAAADPSNESLFDELRVSCRWPGSALALPTGPAQAAGALLQFRASIAQRIELQARAAQADRLTLEGEVLGRQIGQLEEAARSLHMKLAALEAEVPVHLRKAAALEGQLRVQTVAEEDLRRTMVKEVRGLRLEGQLRERAYRPGAAAPSVHLRAEGLELLDRVDAGDHRHLHFSLETLVIGQRTVQGLEFRLLNHLGHPGFALFATTQEPPLAQWETHAYELDRPFMLLIPSESRGQSILQRLGTSDWLLVCTLAQAVSIELASEPEALPAGWRSVASRLGRQLTALPGRLRYDVLSANVPADGPADSVDVCFGNAVFGASLLGSLCVRWWPSRRAEESRLHVLSQGDGAEVPLSSWPVLPGGLLEPQFVCPVGRESSPQSLASLPLHDRELLLAVLDALPGVAAQVRPEASPPGWTADSMAEAASQLNRVTRRMLSRWRVRQAAGRILHRLPRAD